MSSKRKRSWNRIPKMLCVFGYGEVAVHRLFQHSSSSSNLHPFPPHHRRIVTPIADSSKYWDIWNRIPKMLCVFGYDEFAIHRLFQHSPRRLILIHFHLTSEGLLRRLRILQIIGTYGIEFRLCYVSSATVYCHIPPLPLSSSFIFHFLIILTKWRRLNQIPAVNYFIVGYVGSLPAASSFDFLDHCNTHQTSSVGQMDCPHSLILHPFQKKYPPLSIRSIDQRWGSLLCISPVYFFRFS